MSQSSVMEAPRTSAAARTGRNGLSTWVRSMETWFIRRQGWQDLNSLDDHLLRDVGFSRKDLSPEGCRAKLRAANLHD
jgi:uncharacterized protein YjiS (DUF1127 family)